MPSTREIPHATATRPRSTWCMTQVPPALRAVLLRPVPAVATDRGAVVITPTGCLELRMITTRRWEWLGQDETRRPLVRAGKA